MSGVPYEERLMRVLLGPHVSEKTTVAADKLNQVVFKVTRDATKRDIRKAVEKLFKVKVENVTVVNVNGKTKRFGRVEGRRSDWKKAYVRLAPGNDIDFVGIE
jgi:large subunit ribosomal protein L23